MSAFSLRILHISDLHSRAGRGGDEWRRRRVLGAAWEKNLDALMGDGRAVDLVAFTGDLADWGQAAEYEAVTPFFEAILTRLGVGRERLFIVPGNHDIQRKVASDVWSRLRRDLPRVGARERSAWMAGKGAPLGIEESHRDAIMERESAFWSWLGGAMGRGDLLPARSPHGRLGYRSTFRLPGQPFDIHVIGLDSAWLAGDEADTGKLLLTEDQIGLLATGADGRSLPGFRLGLVHHPLSALSDERASRDLLSEHVDLLLRGHLHEPDVVSVSSVDQSLRQIAAGSLYEGDMANNWPNACHMIDVTLDGSGRPSRYDLRLRGYSDRGAGHWFDDGSLSPSAPSGRLQWAVAPSPSAPAASQQQAANPPPQTASNTSHSQSPQASQSPQTQQSSQAQQAPPNSPPSPQTSPTKPLVYIAFHADSRDVLDALKQQLQPLERQGVLATWDTTQIPAGRLIKAERDAALANAKVAVLLVSAGFLADEAIDEQVNRLLAQGTTILCLYVEDTIVEYKQYKSGTGPDVITLTEVGGLNKHDQPLKSLRAPEQASVLAKAAGGIAKAVR